MNQTEKNIFWKNYQDWCWTLLQLSLFFSIFLFLFGPSLWIQSAIFSLLIFFSLVLLFTRQVKRHFKGVILKGYDPWHLKGLKDEYLAQADLSVSSHLTPLIMGYDFYKKKKLILSSAFLNHFKQDERTASLKAMAWLFDNGFFKNLTWISYLFFLIFIPFQPLLFLFRRHHSLKYTIERLPAFLCFCLLLPFRPWVNRQYYFMDQQLSSLFKTKKQYSEWIWKMHTFWEVSNEPQPLYFSPLFLTNPLTHLPFYFNIHPRTERRIKQLAGGFPI